MIRINQIKLHPNSQNEGQELRKKAAKLLRIEHSGIRSLSIVKKSIDARKKPDITMVYTVDVKVDEEQKIIKKCGQKNGQIQLVEEKAYEFPGTLPAKARPVIVGTGPAGLFCGYMLAKAGYRPILLERGREVHKRLADVERFWREGILDPISNVQFGEGGAGTFSDGKLTTTVKDPKGRMREALRIFVEAGAPKEILYEAKPHLGTDILTDVVVNLRKEIEACGGEVRFESQATGLFIENGHVTGVEVNGAPLVSEAVILAIGHSARDTLAMLYEKQLDMEAKPFAVGFRVQHPQAFINETQYGTWETPAEKNGNSVPAKDAASILGAAPYKLTAEAKDGRGVYSFCMCPGGYVVNASSEEGLLAVNGMSYSGRDGACANSAIIVSVSPKDYGDTDFPLSGIAFQRELEKRAYEAAQGKIPIQKYKDFQAELVKQELLREVSYSDAIAPFSPALKGFYKETDITHILPSVLNTAFVEGMEGMNRKIHGFASGEVWLCGIESRTSSPVRICRDVSLQSNIAGIYPCGEGAGYAGGITSAAMDGIKIAEQIGALYHP